MNLIQILNPENVADDEVAEYETRTAVRAVVFDEENNIAVLSVSKKNYHKLPGGGVEEDEDNISALKRECREELGCDIKILGEVGQIIEYRKMFQLKQTSFCFLARVVGEKGAPIFTQEEIDDGFQIKWLSLAQAIKLLTPDESASIEGKLYIVPRDKTFLEAAIKNNEQKHA